MIHSIFYAICQIIRKNGPLHYTIYINLYTFTALNEFTAILFKMLMLEASSHPNGIVVLACLVSMKREEDSESKKKIINVFQCVYMDRLDHR